MKTFYLALLALAFCLISCGKGIDVVYSTYNSDSVQFFDLNPCLGNESYNASDVLDSIKIVALETNENSLVGSVFQTLVTENRIFIHDNFDRSGVIIFDNNGMYIKRLQRGNGPGEINTVKGIVYDKYKNELVVLSPHFISKFDINGNFIEKSELDFPVSSIVGCSESSYIFSKVYDDNTLYPEYNDYSLMVLDKNLVLTHLLLPYSATSKLMMINNTGFQYGDNVIVREPYNDSLFIFKNDSLFLYKTLDISSNKIDFGQFSSFEDFIERVLISNEIKGFWYSGNYCESSTHIIFGLDYLDLKYPIYISKSSNHCVYGFRCCFDIEKDLPICIPKNIYNDWFYELKEANSFPHNTITSNRYISKEDLAKLEQLKEDSNPFIMFYKLKDF